MTAGREPGNARTPSLSVNNIVAIRHAVENGVGIAMLPDYMITSEWRLTPVLPDFEVPSYDCFFVYPEELRDSARVTVFRDFLLANARRGITRRALAESPFPGLSHLFKYLQSAYS